MLCRLSLRWLRPLPALRLGALGPQLAPVLTGGMRRSALPVWAASSVSAVAPGGAGGWYEALATSAPVQGAEALLLCAHTATGLPWWGSILLTTMALRGAVTLPLAAYQHYILAKSIALYWLCSSFMGLSQNLLLRSPRFRQLCRIPLTKSDSHTPYKDLFAALHAKFSSRK
ncbi:hypothetical protein CB1_001109028 [Camelus ferus]|nr:hypothetical protein CB1_001109028 [Camelus ferus]